MLSLLFTLTFIHVTWASDLKFDLCEQERAGVINKILVFDGSENQRREILSEYHYRRKFVNEACEGNKTSEFEQAFLRFTEKGGLIDKTTLTDTYQRRQTKQIDELPAWRIPASATHR